jgi:outer membrane protein assembly factor BamB
LSEGVPISSRARAHAYRALFILWVLSWIALAIWPAAAQVTTGWTQFQSDAAHTGVAADGPSPPFSLAWHAAVEPGGPLGTQGLSEPVVAGDLVIAVAPEEVLAFDLATGAQAWSVPRELGPPAAPAVALIDGRSVLLYTEGWAGHPPEAGATGATGATGSAGSPGETPATPSPGDEQEPAGAVDSRLIAIDLESREPVWDAIELGEASRSGVTVEADRAYVVDILGEVVAIGLETGTLEWSTSIDRPVVSPPAVAGGVVVVAGRGDADVAGASVVGLDAADGTESWRRDIDLPGIVIPSAPAVSEGLAVVTFSDSTVRAFELGSGTERWSVRLGATPTPYGSAAALSGGAAFTSDTTRVTGSVYRIDLLSGRLAWDFALNEPIVRGAPVVSAGALLVATTDGSLNAFDTATGERIWRDSRPGVLRSLAPAGPVVIGVRAEPRAGLDAFEPDPRGQLVREKSPTTPDYPMILVTFLIAALPVVGLALLGGRLLDARLGPPFEPDEGEPA